MSNCHSSNPTGSFSIDANASNNPNAKGIIVNINLPNDQTMYTYDSDSPLQPQGNELRHKVVLKASNRAVPGGVLPVSLSDYTRDDGGSGTQTLVIELFVYLQDNGTCQEVKDDEKPLDGHYKPG